MTRRDTAGPRRRARFRRTAAITTLVTAAVVASANTVADLLYRLVDPRLHRGAS